MRIPNRFKEYLADIFVKVFQIIFAMLVIGMILKERFNISIFVLGLILSLGTLTVAILLYYDLTIKEGKNT